MVECYKPVVHNIFQAITYHQKAVVLIQRLPFSKLDFSLWLIQLLVLIDISLEKFKSN